MSHMLRNRSDISACLHYISFMCLFEILRQALKISPVDTKTIGREENKYNWRNSQCKCKSLAED